MSIADRALLPDGMADWGDRASGGTLVGLRPNSGGGVSREGALVDLDIEGTIDDEAALLMRRRRSVRDTAMAQAGLGPILGACRYPPMR